MTPLVSHIMSGERQRKIENPILDGVSLQSVASNRFVVFLFRLLSSLYICQSAADIYQVRGRELKLQPNPPNF